MEEKTGRAEDRAASATGSVRITQLTATVRVLRAGRSFGSWASLRMELLRANVLSPAHLTHAEERFYRGESWQSPDTVPMTDQQMKEMKLKRQPDQKAISG